MKLLFVCFQYWGERDAGAHCIYRLRAELLRQGVQSDVLTYDWVGDAPQEIADGTGTIYTAKTWYRHARLVRNAAGQIRMSPLRLIKAAATRGFAMLTEGKSYTQRGMPTGATQNMVRRLAELYGRNGYDWVISVSYPFANHLSVLNACPQSCRVALYNLDPYWNNQTYDSNKRVFRAKEEAEAYKKANRIFCTPEQLPDYQNSAFAQVRQKITPLHYPNFTQPHVERVASIQFDPNKINLLYLGTVYGDIRKPDTLFRLFEQASQSEPRLQLYVIGKKFGKDADRYLVEYQKKLGNRLAVFGRVPVKETADLMRQADILVNLGNMMHNQMPSKTMEYLATGKPILNVSARRDCNTLPLMERYPLRFQRFAAEPLTKERISEFLDFCRICRGKALSWNAVGSLYPELQISGVAERLICSLTESVD